MMLDKETIGLISIAATVASVVPYYYSILYGRTKPAANTALVMLLLLRRRAAAV